MSLKQGIKKAIKSLEYGRRAMFIRELYRHEKRIGGCQKSKLSYFIKNINSVRVYQGKNSAEAIAMMFCRLTASIQTDGHFFYSLIRGETWSHEFGLFGNTTVDYRLLLDNSLQDLLLDGNDDYAQKNNQFVNALIVYAERVADEIMKSENNYKKEMAKNLRSIATSRAKSFEEALQRILFTNQILWQTGHKLNGLGNLDSILYSYYKDDLKRGVLKYDAAKKLIEEFCYILHGYYEDKSNCLVGDTGQTIILGGSDENGFYQRNELTDIFIDVIMDLHLPDPKLLFRVNKNIPDDLLHKAVRCIATGIGSPLLANDDVIIPAMCNFGYKREDAVNYAVAACWEPIVPGKTFELNNVGSINYAKPLIKLFNSDVDYKQYDDLLNDYLYSLKKYVNQLICNTSDLVLNEDIVMSIFMPECRKNRKDITEGGLPYNHIGFTGVGMGCAVNSLLSLKKLVYEDKIYTLENIENALKSNFADYGKMQQSMLNSEVKYGRDIKEVVELTEKIVSTVEDCCNQRRTVLGGNFKFGLSSPSYIDAGELTGATPDGRKSGEPFSTHISCDDGIAHTELMQFAGKLDYSGARLNGNVVDFIVAPTFLTENIDKFVIFLKQSIKLGFFELQMNVVDSKTLIAARKNPEAFPNLIVRVWGFSAYFKDLPDEYKDVLIQRALQAEKAA